MTPEELRRLAEAVRDAVRDVRIDRFRPALNAFATPSVAESVLSLLDERERLREALNAAKLQIEYLHEKFRVTGSGNAVLARIAAALEPQP